MAFVEEADLGFEGVRMGKGVIFLSHFQTSLLSSQRLFFFFFFAGQSNLQVTGPSKIREEASEQGWGPMEGAGAGYRCSGLRMLQQHLPQRVCGLPGPLRRGDSVTFFGTRVQLKSYLKFTNKQAFFIFIFLCVCVCVFNL